MCGLTDDDLSLAESDQPMTTNATLSTVDEETSIPGTPGA